MARTSQSTKEEMRTSGNTELYRRTESSGNSHDTITQTQQLGTIRGRDYSSDKYETGGAVDSRTLATAKSFTFTRNGKDWTQSFKAAEFIEFVLNLRKQILGLIEFFKALGNKMPKIGWTFSVEVEVFAGSLEYEWGYKEWPKNHTVYKYYKVEVALTLVSAKAEIAFGLELLSAKAQVYGAVTGELKLTFSREANPDRTGPAGTMSVPPSVGGEIGVRGALGDWVEVVGKINAGFEGAATMELGPFSLKANFDLSPAEGTFTAKSKLFFSVTKSGHAVGEAADLVPHDPVTIPVSTVDYLNVSIHGYACEVFVNRAPILRTPVDVPYTAIPSVSEWLVSGDNEIAVRIDAIAPPAATADPLSPRRLIVQRCVGPLGEIVPAGEDQPIDGLTYAPAPDDPRPTLPLRIAYEFRLPPGPTWAWQTAARAVARRGDHRPSC